MIDVIDTVDTTTTTESHGVDIGRGVIRTAAFVAGNSVAGPVGGIVARVLVDILMD